MKNPWKSIDLDTYESHMSLSSVYQLQTLNKMMKGQINSYHVDTIMILGIAGGNGLEHIDGDIVRKVYGVDINKNYLKMCKQRYAYLGETFETISQDLTKEGLRLPHAELLIADLVIEYVGCECFKKVADIVNPAYISCIIQINNDVSFVSDSPYLHAFDGLNEVHRQVEEKELAAHMEEIGYETSDRNEEYLPNGKKLVRMDFINKTRCGER